MQDALRGLGAAIAGSGGVLLCGEPGSGRELFARAIHHAAGSADPGGLEELLRRSMHTAVNGRPFVTIDCGDRESLEQRVFGTSRAADPASQALERIREGSALHAGAGGTVVFRQIAEMPPRMQQRLARILRDGEAWLERHTGEELVAQVALRPMGTAERQDGEALAADLHKRIAHAVIAVPPLRARREDIPGLVRCLLADACASAPVEPKTVSRQAVDLLAALPWRGNVTELDALLRTLAHRVAARQIRLSDVLAHVRLDGHVATAMYGGTLKEARERFEREYVAAVLEQHRGRMAEAARALGLQRTNLYRKVRQLSVRRSAGRQLL
jgi:two-component system nitrogen regulation response regulator NtrX